MTELERLISVSNRPFNRMSNQAGIRNVSAPFGWLGFRRFIRKQTRLNTKALMAKGTRYKVTRKFAPYYHISFQAPFSAGNYLLLPIGTILLVHEDSPTGSEAVFLEVEAHYEVGMHLVPDHYQSSPYYVEWYIQTDKTEMLRHTQVAS